MAVTLFQLHRMPAIGRLLKKQKRKQNVALKVVAMMIVPAVAILYMPQSGVLYYLSPILVPAANIN